MGVEIERKFLVKDMSWREGLQGCLYRQGYLSVDPARSVRVRLAGNQAWITIKGMTKGISRPEFEYEIPCKDADFLLDQLCLRPLIEKSRYRRKEQGRYWEIDEFFGDNAGLILAEIELSQPDEPIALPPWIGKEVTGNPAYYNSSLILRPFRTWQANTPPFPGSTPD